MLFSDDLITSCPYRQALRDCYRSHEDAVIDKLLPFATMNATRKAKAWNRARKLVDFIRLDSKGQKGIDALLNEFSLSSDEGVVLMCLAEALLRVPDKKTQDDLIKDKISKGRWSAHLGNSESLFVNASSWALLLTGKVVNYSHAKYSDQLNLLQKSIVRVGEPVIRKSVNLAMRIMGKQFVTGRTIDEALSNAKSKHTQAYRFSFDMLGEAARTMADADNYFESYLDAIHAIGVAAKGRGPIDSPGISVKLSAIHPRFEFAQKQRVMDELVPKLKILALAAKSYDIGFTVDAEEADRLDLSLDIIECIVMDPELDGWEGFGLAIQAYQKRTIAFIEWLKQLSIRSNKKLMVRLVKGAYWDTEIKRCQQQGLNEFPVFTRKAATDICYIAAAAKLLESRAHFYPQFATHNALTAATILELAGTYNDDYEFQRLHGMGESLFSKILEEEGVACRIYAPVGVHEDLLAYLVRRLLENGANSSFVNAILDESKSLDALLADPYDKIVALKEKHDTRIAKSSDLFSPERVNSKGLDITDINELVPLKEALDQNEKALLSVQKNKQDTHAVVSPANHKETIGYVKNLHSTELPGMIDQAEKAFGAWSKLDVNQRADTLLHLADLLEENRNELITLCIKEAGKVLADAVDEIREAVDFCRYYAAQSRRPLNKNTLPRGIVLCISPWNFPLAIFMGQVSAALVVGNTVLAKPAEQTVLIAERALALMHEAGIPQHVVQLVVASGEDVGGQIVTDKRISAVMFTGSTETGKTIARTLAQRPGHPIPLIAETGGQNCMIVDSTALLEQVVDDAISSGFQSAGQRCSALRVLFVQEDVADQLIELLIGAMKELCVADPKWLSTDIGPVIDKKALNALQAHVDYLDDKAKLLFECPLQNMPESHTFFAPKLYEIEHINVLKREVFGPCVHVIRYKANKLEQVMKDINRTGYGLTMGIHSRIEERTLALAAASKAGNIYINRNMIGAVVGVQPFGGHGLSGTGPKAGGPNYLGRLTQDYHADNDQVDVGVFEIKGASENNVGTFFKSANEIQNKWQQLPLNDRIIYAKQLAAVIADSQRVESLQIDVEKTLVLINEQLNFIKHTFKTPVILPGPTGESNSLHYEARGCVLNYANIETSFLHWMTSLLSAIVVGNTVISIVSDEFYPEAVSILKAFENHAFKGVLQLAKCADLQNILNHPHLTAVIIGTECKQTSFIKQALAKRDGAIIPVVNAESNRLPVSLLLEKTISIDTTASGGNAALMAMDE